MIELINNIWAVVLDTAFWLLIGLLAAGVIKTYIPEEAMRRWVGGKGIGAVSRAALIGAPLPLCSCGVLPTAIGLHRAGASKEATVSFLISTPETSIDSIAVTYALMGPIMAIYRPFAALMSAVITGMLTALINDEKKLVITENVAQYNPNETTVDAKGFNPHDTTVEGKLNPDFNANETTVDAKSHHGFNAIETSVDAKSDASFNPNDTTADAGVKYNASSQHAAKAEEKSCCSTDTVDEVAEESSRWFKSLQYAGAELLDDISKWLAFGIVLAGIMLTYVPIDWLAQWGSGLSAMLIMLVVGVPLYICAVASTPVAASLLLAGVSPGAVLVFLLVGPATNIASFALVKKELGLKVTLVYLMGLSVVSVAMGLLLEWMLRVQNWQIDVQLGEEMTMLPMWLSWGSAILLVLLAIKPIRKRLIPQLG